MLKMLKIDLNKPLLDIDDKETSENLGKVLGSMLKTSQTGDALKHLCWAVDLYRTGIIEVDQPDFDYIEKFVKDSQAWALVKGRIMRELKDQRTAQL